MKGNIELLFNKYSLNTISPIFKYINKPYIQERVPQPYVMHSCITINDLRFLRCPSNIEFTRRANGLKSVDEVREKVFNATNLVIALGDVYLGAPLSTPLDPCHRLVTTKYNPARTW